MYLKALALSLFLGCLALAPARAQQEFVSSPETEASLEADEALDCLAALDAALDANPGATPQELSALNLNLDETTAQPVRIEHLMAMPGTERPYGISPFLWGFVLSVPGAAAVYFLTHERRPTHQAILGAMAGGVAFGLLYFIVINPVN